MTDERARADQEILAKMREKKDGESKVPNRGASASQEAEEAVSRQDVSGEEAQTRAERKAKIAQLLHRGLVNARLEVKDGDPNKYYCWVREHDPDIERMAALGFEIETEAGKVTHGAGDNRRRLGDVILMSTSRENYEIIQEVRAEQKARKSQLGKREYLRRVASGGAAPALDPLGVGLED